MASSSQDTPFGENRPRHAPHVEALVDCSRLHPSQVGILDSAIESTQFYDFSAYADANEPVTRLDSVTGAYSYRPKEGTRSLLRALDYVASGKAETILESLHWGFKMNSRKIVMRMLVMTRLLEAMVIHSSERSYSNAEGQVLRRMEAELETLILSMEGRETTIGEAQMQTQLVLASFLDEFGLAYRQDELLSPLEGFPTDLVGDFAILTHYLVDVGEVKKQAILEKQRNEIQALEVAGQEIEEPQLSPRSVDEPFLPTMGDDLATAYVDPDIAIDRHYIKPSEHLRKMDLKHVVDTNKLEGEEIKLLKLALEENELIDLATKRLPFRSPLGIVVYDHNEIRKATMQALQYLADKKYNLELETAAIHWKDNRSVTLGVTVMGRLLRHMAQISYRENLLIGWEGDGARRAKPYTREQWREWDWLLQEIEGKLSRQNQRLSNNVRIAFDCAEPMNEVLEMWQPGWKHSRERFEGEKLITELPSSPTQDIAVLFRYLIAVDRPLERIQYAKVGAPPVAEGQRTRDMIRAWAHKTIKKHKERAGLIPYEGNNE